MMKMKRMNRSSMRRKMRMRLLTTRSKTRITILIMKIAARDNNNNNIELAGKTLVRSHHISLNKIHCHLLIQTRRSRRISI
jgi:hypothetical protein